MRLKPFSAVVDERFRIKLAFDTNLLMYLLDSDFPKLNQLVIEFSSHDDFVDLITNRYTLFELYEKRKEKHFLKIAIREGYDLKGINSDKFYVHDSSKFQKIITMFSFEKFFGDRIRVRLERLRDNLFTPNVLVKDGLFFNFYSEIMNLVKGDLPRIENEFGITTTGTLHDQLWMPTSELIYHSRISREDSLVATAFIKPDLVRSEKNLAILTNDGDFEKFYSEAQNRGLIIPLFARLNFVAPLIERISRLKAISGSQVNLRNSIGVAFNTKEFALGYIKKLIVENNKASFLGFTSLISPKSPKIIGLKVVGEAEYDASNNLLVIGRDLDFIYLIPYSITVFKNSNSETIILPLNKNHKKVCFQHTDLGADDPDKSYESQILVDLKKEKHLVFVV